MAGSISSRAKKPPLFEAIKDPINAQKRRERRKGYRARLKGGPQVARMLQADQADEVSNSRNKDHQTWGPPFSRVLYRDALKGGPQVA